MSEEEVPLSQHDQLAMAIAQGESATGWARQNNVPERTARRWARDPDVRRQVEEWRRGILDQALGYLAGHSMWAVKGITELGETAESESVQLRARRAVLHDQIAVSRFSNMEYRMAEIEEEIRFRNGEEEIRARNGHAAHPG